MNIPNRLPIETAPRDGTPILAWFDNSDLEPYEIRWAEERVCMGAGSWGGHGYFGPGWEDTYNHLIVSEEPTHWMPV